MLRVLQEVLADEWKQVGRNRDVSTAGVALRRLYDRLPARSDYSAAYVQHAGRGVDIRTPELSKLAEAQRTPRSEERHEAVAVGK